MPPALAAAAATPVPVVAAAGRWPTPIQRAAAPPTAVPMTATAGYARLVVLSSNFAGRSSSSPSRR